MTQIFDEPGGGRVTVGATFGKCFGTNPIKFFGDRIVLVPHGYRIFPENLFQQLIIRIGLKRPLSR